MYKYKIQYLEHHYYHNYEDDRWFGGGVIYTLSKEFNSEIEAEQYAKAHEWEWDKNPDWKNKKYQIIKEKIPW